MKKAVINDDEMEVHLDEEDNIDNDKEVPEVTLKAINPVTQVGVNASYLDTSKTSSSSESDVSSDNDLL